jgi:hypothetical protein
MSIYRSIFILTLICGTSFSSNSQNVFTGVFRMEGRSEYILSLKKAATAYRGYFGEIATAEKIQGNVKGDFMEVRFSEGEDSTVNYLFPDAAENLQLTDGVTTAVTFIRTTWDPDSFIKVMEMNRGAGVKESKTPIPGSAASRYAGKKFLHLYTGNGYTEKWAYYLYTDGTFRFSGDNSYVSSDASTTFSGATATAESGTWDVVSANGAETLVLNWRDGTTKRMPILRNANGYDLNGTRYFLVGLTEYE